MGGSSLAEVQRRILVRMIEVRMIGKVVVKP